MSQQLRRSRRLKEKREREAANVSHDEKENKNDIIQKKKIAKKVKNKNSKKIIGKSNNKNKKYWLMKSEPSSYSIDDLLNEGEAGDYWDGIRNYQVRNMIRDEIKCDDEALFYHSCCKPPGIAGSMIITKECYVDFTAFDKNEKYYDPKSSKESPKWFMFNVKIKNKFSNYISLPELKKIKEISNMKILQKGNRLSITEITKQEYDYICELGQ